MTHTKTPWRQGMPSKHGTYHPGTIYQDVPGEFPTAIASVFGIPVNCKLEDITEPKYREALDTLAFICRAANSHERMREALEPFAALAKRFSDPSDIAIVRAGGQCLELQSIDLKDVIRAIDALAAAKGE